MKSADANTARPILMASNLEQNSLLMHYAAEQARRGGARVILVHVVPLNPTEKKTSPGIVRIADPSLCRAVRERLEFAALQLLWHGIVCDPVVLSGEPAEQIAALARARGADRVLVSARKLSNEADSSDASLVGRLLGKLDIPLFVLGPAASSLPEADASDGRMLLALSLRHNGSVDYVKFGSRLARDTCSRLALLHVVNASGMTEQQRQQAHLGARTNLAALAATEQNPLFPIEILVREADVVQSIVGEAMCPHRDLILLGRGSTNRRASSRQGVIHQVIASASCPVVILNAQHDTEAEFHEAGRALPGAAD